MGGAPSPTFLITGAAGNLGGMLARHLVGTGVRLRLMVHRSPLAEDLEGAPDVEVVRANLADPAALDPAVRGADAVVHFAGVLFAPRPERFLPVTNTVWCGNLVRACIERGVSRFVLISFPHVEGPTSAGSPAVGRLDRDPPSVHARTRLEAERSLFSAADGTATTPVSLRLGMVYGRGVLMVEAARWLARRRLLAVWRDPTWIHLVSAADYLEATTSALTRPGVRGIYHVGDERPVTLQEFLDRACLHWGYPSPWRLPLWMIRCAATLCEGVASLTGLPAPLTRDFLTIGRVSYWGDTGRTRRELLPTLRHPDLESGLHTL